jgi:hypothetical protein
LYLARKTINGATHYFIRETYRDRQVLRSRDLLHLGTNPARLIRYPGGNAYYVDEAVEDVLSDAGVHPSGDELDEVFWDFIRPDIRRKLEPFRRREFRSRAARQVPPPAAPTDHHIFDKRRMLFLRTGRLNQTGIEAVPPSLFRRLENKSRDEIEQTFIKMERDLRPSEVKNYVFVIFNLQEFFQESFAGTIPHFLDQGLVDAHFLETLCRLNENDRFWSGMERGAALHEYLVRYLVMFFDFDYQPRNFMGEYVRRFINDHRDYRPPPPQTHVSMGEAATVFGETRDALNRMDGRELARRFRRKAQTLHPDKGGDSRKFIQLVEAYKSLLRRKRKRQNS